MSDERRGATLACEAGVPPEQLSAWRDGEQPPEHAQWLARHVAGCPACQARMRDYRQIGADLQRQMIPAHNADPWPAMRSRLAEPRRWAFLPRGLARADRATWSRIGAVVAATLLIALFAALLARQAALRPSPTTTPTPHATATAAPAGAWNAIADYSGHEGLVLAPSNPNVAYQFWLNDSKSSTGTHTFTLTMRRTTDQGAHWTNLKPPAIPGVTYPNINGMFSGFVSPLNPQVVYLIIEPTDPRTGVCLATNPPTDCAFEFVSMNGGQSWQKLSLPAPDLLTGLAINHNGSPGIAGDLQAQGKRLFGVITTARALGAEAPPPPARLVASDDGGVTWRLIDGGFRAAGQDVYSYSAAPAGGVVFVVTESLNQPSAGPNPSLPTLFLWRSNDSGSHWTQVGPIPYASLSDMRTAWDATNNVPVLYLAVVTGGGKSLIVGSRGGGLNGFVAASATPANGSQTGPTLLTTLRDGTLVIEAGGAIQTWNVTPSSEASGWTQVAQSDGLSSFRSAFTQTVNGQTRLWLTGETQSSFAAQWTLLSSGIASAPTATATTTQASGAAWTSASSLAQASNVAPASLRIQYNASLGATSKTSSPQFTLQRSDDWGQTWTNLTPPQIPGVTYPDGVNTIVGLESPVNPQVFILTLQLNNSSSSACPASSGRVCQVQYVTANGGASWQKLSLPTAGMLGLSLPFGFSQTNIVAQGSRVYSVVSDVQLASSGAIPPGRLVVSNDGGVTWQVADSTLASRGLFIYNYTASPSGSSVYAIVGANNTNLSPGAVPALSLWRSDDAGATWTKGATLPTQNVNFQLLAASNQTTGKNTLFLLMGSDPTTSSLSYSADDGASWSATTTVSSPNDPNVLLATLPSGAVLLGGGGSSGGLAEWNGATKNPTTVTQPTGLERIDAAYVTPLSGGKVQIFLIGHDQNGQGYWEYTQLAH